MREAPSTKEDAMLKLCNSALAHFIFGTRQSGGWACAFTVHLAPYLIPVAGLLGFTIYALVWYFLR